MDEPLLLRLAERALAFDAEDLSDDAIARAKALLLDTVGCALGAVDSNVLKAVHRACDVLGGSAMATVIGTPFRANAPWATFANGTALRYLDANDYYFGRDPAHPSGNFAAALAVGEEVGASGADLLAAMAAAYALHLDFADAAGAPNLWDRGWHHGTNAQFSAAVAAARLYRCDARTTAHAMAIAGSHHNTLAQLQSGAISNIKATAEAWVAKGAVEATLLARHGITGPLDLIEGRFGWAATVAGGLDEPMLFGTRRARFGDVSVKPYPAVATAMAPIDAALALHARHRFAADEVAALTVTLPRFALATPSGKADRRHPATRESADHSFYYCAAVALVDGACGDAQFAASRIADPTLAALLDRTELEEDAEFTDRWPGTAGGGIAVRLHDGRRFGERRPFPPGHPSNPLDRSVLLAKFHTHADPVLGRARADAAIAAIDTLESCPDLRDLMPLLATDRLPATGHAEAR